MRMVLLDLTYGVRETIFNAASSSTALAPSTGPTNLTHMLLFLGLSTPAGTQRRPCRELATPSPRSHFSGYKRAACSNKLQSGYFLALPSLLSESLQIQVTIPLIQPAHNDDSLTEHCRWLSQLDSVSQRLRTKNTYYDAHLASLI
jgi:hypothetical protein